LEKEGKIEMKRNWITRVLLLLAVTAGGLFGQNGSGPVNLAILAFENMDESDEFDYIGTLASSFIREDLTHGEEIVLVDRDRLNRVLEEQQRQLSGIMDGETTVQIGKLIGCDYLCSGNYVIMDEEVLLDITLTQVESGRVTSFSTRGDTEDIFHLAAEKLVSELTDRKVIFRTASSNRPIIKHVLKKPGTLKFHSYLIDARIYIDGEFYGYTTGDKRNPTLIELPPGEHSIMIDLGQDFGFVTMPEVSFDKWHENFIIESGQTLVLEDKSRHFNDWINEMRRLIRNDADFYNGDVPARKGEAEPFSFTDRKGNPVSGTLAVDLGPGDNPGGITARITLEYGEESEDLVYICPAGEEKEYSYTLGLVDLEVSLDAKWEGRASADWDLTRNDIHQGMHREM
jgi:TolB-like protein